MTSKYEKIFSRFRGRVDDSKLANMSIDTQTEYMVEWLHAVASNSRVRRKFTTLSLDDEIMEMKYELSRSVDKESDMEFVEDIFCLGMQIEWLEPKVNSILYTAPVIGGKDEKKLLDSHKYNIQRLDSMKTELKKKLRDYGYIHNSYTSTE